MTSPDRISSEISGTIPGICCVRGNGPGDLQHTSVVALFGLGRIGTIYFQHILTLPRIRLKFIVESELCLERAAQLLCEHRVQGCEVLLAEENGVNQVLTDPEVVSVLICTPTDQHFDLACRAIRGGKAVFCEKPLAATALEIDVCFKLAAEFNQILYCSFNRRWDPALRQIHDLVTSGAIGSLRTVRTISRDHKEPAIDYLKCSGRIFHDCAIHDLDLVCWLIGEWPTSVYAVGHAHNADIRAVGDVDTAAVTLKFPSGAIGIIEVGRLAPYGYDQRLEVYGSDGRLTSENPHRTCLNVATSGGFRLQPLADDFRDRYRDSYKNSLNHFVDAIQGKCKLETPSSLKISFLCSACDESLRSGRPVELHLSMS